VSGPRSGSPRSSRSTIARFDDALWSEVRRHFSEAEIVELVAHATLYIGFGRFNEIVGVDPESMKPVEVR